MARLILNENPSPEDPVGGDGGSVGFNIGTTIKSVTFVKKYDDSALRIEAYAAVSNEDDLQMPSYLVLDGTVIQYGNINQIYDGTTSRAASTIFLKQILMGVAAGQHTITFSMRNVAIRRHSTIVATGANVEVLEVTQAAM